jgi:hypothetical protein
MKRFGVDEVIIGDLTEQRHAGRSVAWLWMQTLGAVAVAILADIRRHPIAAVQAVIVGLILREAHRALWSVLWHYANVELARSLPPGFMPLGVAVMDGHADGDPRMDRHWLAARTPRRPNARHPHLGHVFDMIIAVAGMPVAMMCAGLVSAGYGRLTQAGGGCEAVLP